jgi:multimeric flavodoxin WrbA
MKVIGVMSSPRAYGNTMKMVQSVLEGASKVGAETEIIMLTEQNVEFCTGCMNCMATGSCHLQDDFHTIREKLKSADGIVFGSPTYMNGYNAQLKILLERFGIYEHLTSETFGGKYFAVVSSAGGRVGNTIKQLSNQVGIFDRGYYTGGLGLPVKGMEASDHPVELAKCESLGNKLVEDIIVKNPYKFQNLIQRIVTKVFIRPKYKEVIIRNKEHSQKAIYDYLHVSGKL